MENQKMNQEFKEEWCQALESGLFPQGKSALCDKGRYCCLGVAEHLLVKKGVVREVIVDGLATYIDKEIEENLPNTQSSYALTRGSRDYMGIQYYLPEVVTDVLNPGSIPVSIPLSSLNDNGIDFITIAKLIREQL